jgi:uncharacterized protein YegP (UPF0339 family)
MGGSGKWQESALHGIESVRHNAAEATVEDKTEE